MKVEELKPCPCCGNERPFKHISFDYAVLECDCGIGIAGCKGGVSTIYDSIDKVPDELKEHTYEPSCLIFKLNDGSQSNAVDLGYVGVSLMAAFQHAGLTKIWNERV